MVLVEFTRNSESKILKGWTSKKTARRNLSGRITIFQNSVSIISYTQGLRIINKNPIFWLPVTVARFKTAQ